jgi:predicted NBD/HSP70 family sugar kinase
MIVILSRDRRLNRATCQNSVGAANFKRPTKIINDAAMQALGSYRNGKMLFLGLGTGLGLTLIANGILEPMELGHLPYKEGTYEDCVGARGLHQLQKAMAATCSRRRCAFDCCARTNRRRDRGRQR